MEIFPPQRERRGEKRAKKSLPQRSNYLEMIKQSSQKFIQRLLRDSGAKKIDFSISPPTVCFALYPLME